MATRNAITINPYTNVRKMTLNYFWHLVDAQEALHAKYTYTLNSTVTVFDVVYSTVYSDTDKSTVAYSDFFAHIAEQMDVDGVAIVMQHCDAFDMVFVIED